MPVVKLNEDGLLPLPEEIRHHLGLAPGQLVNLDIDDNGNVLIKPCALPDSTQAIPHQTIPPKDIASPVSCIRGVGPKMAEALIRRGVATVEDALYLLPHRYEDRRDVRKIAQLRAGNCEVFFAEIQSADVISTRSGKKHFEVLASDHSGSIILKWFRFNQSFMKKIWKKGNRGLFTGEVVQYGFQREVHHPDVEWCNETDDMQTLIARDPLSFGKILPVYPLTEGISQKMMRKVMKEVVDGFVEHVPDSLPGNLIARYGLLPVHTALRATHFPPADTEIAALNGGDHTPHRTLAFDEFYYLELGLAMKRRGIVLEEGIPFSVSHRYTRELLKLLPFSLTAAQRRVLSEIKSDMMLPQPMHRLVQGDVGCGKTLVALLAALVAVENDYQVAIMAPTEILAEQHFLNIHGWCEQLGVRVTLLTSGLKGKGRDAVLTSIASGDTQIAIGTHAVIQERVDFKRLGLGIIDEQHRFGVAQRSLLKKKGSNPDILVMTATPIPRTLAMTVYGDLSLSVIDELPPGRTPVETRICYESRREQVYGIIREEIARGRQAYLIYPLVEETEKSDLKAATQMAEHLANDVFPTFRIGILHGRMKPEEKEAVMRSFKERNVDILVATTVIEVGIDVPNATVMVIEHAERFGLTQLHQLRGRVGRGSDKSRCLLLTTGRLSEDGEKRLKVMEQSNDGFRIAEADLEIRGPGDFIGTRQAGIPDLRVADILRDGRILEEARQEAFALVELDPDLASAANAPLRRELVRRWGGRLELAGIG
jgi:ATP-dependent DNA helicase RecG